MKVQPLIAFFFSRLSSVLMRRHHGVFESNLRAFAGVNPVGRCRYSHLRGNNELCSQLW